MKQSTVSRTRSERLWDEENQTNQETARRQPQRNRHPRLPRRHRTRPAHRRHLLAGRPLRLHRFKADEAYLVGAGKGPVEAYLDIDGIVAIAKEHGVDAIHPGYGFLSENAGVRARLRKSRHHLRRPDAGVARNDRRQNRRANARRNKPAFPTLPGTEDPVTIRDEAQKIAKEIGYPAHHQSRLRRRRPRHARRRTRPTISTHRSKKPRARPARLRRRRGLPRKIHPARQAHRSADPRRSPRQCRCTCTSAIAPCSAATRRSSRSRPPSNLPQARSRRALRRRRAHRAQSRTTTTPARSNSSTMSTRNEVLLHRGQPAHPGRAHRHRSGHRHRPRPMRRSSIAQGHKLHEAPTRHARAGRTSRSRLRDPVPHHHRRSRKQFHPRLRPDLHLPLARRVSASASTAARLTPARSSRRTTIRCW